MTEKRSKANDNNADSRDNLAALCQFPFTDGRQCRMLRAKGHRSLCLFHARAEQQLIESKQLGAELASTISGQFLTATDINFVLGKLFTALAQNRIPARNAATLAYIGQLMLQAIPTVKQEYKFHYSFEKWGAMEENAIQLSGSQPEYMSHDDAASDDSSDESISDDTNSTVSPAEPVPTS